MLKFVYEFVTNPASTGAVVPSSDSLAMKMIGMAALTRADSIVELGPGTGVFTEKILERIAPGKVFFALEINPSFVRATKKRCPEAVVYQDTAARMAEYLRIHGTDYCDCVISGLPWASFDYGLQEEILQAVVDSLRPGGEFLTFAYLQGLLLPAGRRFRKLLKSRFSEVSTTSTIWRNCPPAFVYHCIR